MIEAGISENPMAIIKDKNIPSEAPSLFMTICGIGMGSVVTVNLY
jgi:hypothetical protein